MDNFIYGDITLSRQSNVYVARLKQVIDNKKTLLEDLASELMFPDYFGHNWDALWDSIRYLDEIKAHNVILIHEKTPRLSEKDMLIYIKLLHDAVIDWKHPRHEDLHNLIVVFPPDDVELIKGYLEMIANNKLKNATL